MTMSPLKSLGLLVAVLVTGLITGRYLMPAHTDHTTAPTPDLSAEEQASIWTCSMHPQIQQPGPGACPICGMDLIPVLVNSDTDDGPRAISMSQSARALADIETTLVRRAFPEVRVRLVGKLDYDETRLKSLTARFPARIDELFVNYTGIRVEAGQHLARVYSPELLSAQRELLTAHAADPHSSITRAARDKLRLWDLLPEQVEGIIERGQAQDYFILRAPIGGVVVTKKVQEGDYIKTGESLFRIVDLSELWLRLDAYESDLTWLRYGQDVSFTVQAFPGETFHGRIAFIDPEVDRKTRTVPIRVDVPNTDGRLKPGMFARGLVEAQVAVGGAVNAPELAGKWISPMHPEIIKDAPGLCDICGMDLVSAESLGYIADGTAQASLIVPTSAVLRTGRRAVVYVERPDAPRPSYDGREIVLGPRAGDYFVVVSGLQEGERVVTRGAFKIDSALQIQAKPSMMNPTGGGPPPGHDHGSQPMTSNAASAASAAGAERLAVPAGQLAALIEPYLKLQAALAADDLQAARAQAGVMMKTTGHSGPLPELLHAMQAATDLEVARLPHFAALSEAMIAAVRYRPGDAGGSLLRMHCPMADGSHGADWLQRAEPVRNPYFGATMPGCGDIEERITAAAEGHEGHGH